MVSKDEENKKRGFYQWKLNLLALIKFVQPHWMANKMDFIIAIKWQPKPFWSPSNLVTTGGWRPKKGEYDMTPSYLFQSPTRMGD
jgi:hypothetical protein